MFQTSIILHENSIILKNQKIKRLNIQINILLNYDVGKIIICG